MYKATVCRVEFSKSAISLIIIPVHLKLEKKNFLLLKNLNLHVTLIVCWVCFIVEWQLSSINGRGT